MHCLHRRILITLAFVGVVALLHSQSAGTYIREGNKYFEHGLYRIALQYYKQGGNAQTWKKDVKLRAAIAQYEINELDGSVVLLNELVRAGKTDPMVFFYLGRCYHHKQLFSHALNAYKEYLRRDPKDDERIAWVKDEILRCANGLRQRYGLELAYVENLGAQVNSMQDDYAPVPSPNYEERVYFTSSREGSEGGLLGDDGFPDLKYGLNRSDIYYVENVQGIWQPVVAMDNILNSRLYEELYCFSMDGQELYFRRGKSDKRGQLVIDTFSSSTPVSKGQFVLGPFNPQNGDRDLIMYNDSIMLFSSDRAGGFGGYDIYFSVRRKGRWGEAMNVGGGINGFYDEVSPFLARNGRLLYFSSNRLESIGGLDVFLGTFNDTLQQWLTPVNLGLPINSAGDDVYFRLGLDGQKAYLSSDRKSGYGGSDLYVAYFKDQVREHLALSIPLTFIQLMPRDRRQADVAVNPDKREVREYVISDLWFEANDVIITPQNIKKLEVLTNLLLIYPTLTLDLICHEMPTGPRSYDLFFSVKKSEEVAAYLARKGVARNRIFTKGCGAFYPIAVSGTAQDNPAVSRLNRRIEIHVYHAEEQPVILAMDQPNVPESLRDEKGRAFDRLQDQLVFRIQIAETSQLYQNDIFDHVADAMVDYQGASRTYRYLVGMETQYAQAVEARDAFREQGFPQAKIVAYLNGVQLSREEALLNAERYPELLQFAEE